MSLSTGAQIGPYTIGDEIGSGGMGVVFRATDQNLKRDVAIKALPESLASDVERLARFQREAEVLASLNHPNIAQIYGLEKADGTTALVMELVDGPTLADRIATGPLPADEALGVAMQVADALEAAHSRSIVHRDLKPANIKLRPDGTVKVLDFGIAKALEPDSIRTEPQSPMLTTPATQVGVILGTAAYMSPEQAKGQPVDQRADIWAFGCVLYEMLTGQLVFGAPDVATTLARVIANEPTLDVLPSNIAPAMRRTIELCLEKDLRQRISAIADVRLALQGRFETNSPSAAGAVQQRQLPMRFLVFAAATVAAAAVISGLTVFVQMQPTPGPIDRFEYVLPGEHSLSATQISVFALSPDGRRFAYNTEDGLYVREMDSLVARLIQVRSDVGNTAAPFFSPDGRSIGYFSRGEVKRVAMVGGAPVPITRFRGRPDGAVWTEDDLIYYGQPEGIFRVSASGGTSELVIAARDGEEVFGPQPLPDGDSIIFGVRASNSDEGTVVVESMSTGERRVLVERGNDARYVAPGYIVYALEDALFARRFDADRLMVSGASVPLAEGLMRAIDNPSANYDIANDGTLVYFQGNLTLGTHTLVWVGRDGSAEPVNAQPRNYVSPRISPDGQKVALDSRDEQFDIWTWDFARDVLSRVTTDPGSDEFPVWSPDGTRIAFSSTRGGGQSDTSVYWRAADGTGEAEFLADSDGQIFPTSFLPDGSGILVYGTPGDPDRQENDDDISILMLGEDRAIPLLESVTAGERFPEISPNQRWLAYESDASGRSEIYLRPYPDVQSRRIPVSTGGGTNPLWRPDGTELYYRLGDAVMVVSVDQEGELRLGIPERLFEGPYIMGPGGRAYDVSPIDGRFLMIRENEEAGGTVRVVITQNWTQELIRLLPLSD